MRKNDTSVVRVRAALAAAGLAAVALVAVGSRSDSAVRGAEPAKFREAGDTAGVHGYAEHLIRSGRTTFRHDTFGDEAFWGGLLRLHEAIEGQKLGGVGPGVSPEAALAVGLKVDVDALPQSLRDALKAGQVDLKDPATTVALLKPTSSST